MTQSAVPSSAPSRPRPSPAAAAAQKKAALRDRTLRFTGDAVLVVCGLNVLLLAAMFWVGYVNGKKAARAELKLSSLSVGTADDPRLRSDAEAKLDPKQAPKQEWEAPPASPQASTDGAASAKGDPAAAKDGGSTTAPAPSGSDKSATSSEKPVTSGDKPATPERKWVVQAVSYEMSRQDLAESWKEKLIQEKFENVELYKLGKDRPMIGLCVGEATSKQDLEEVLKRVQEFTSRNERPFASASITQLAVTRR